MLRQPTREDALPTPRVRGLSDAALIGRVAAHDEAAFDVLHDRHAGAAWAQAYRALGSRQPADDVCQESFVSVWRSAGRFDPDRGDARAWLFTIVRNRTIDHLRKSRGVRERELADDALAERQPGPADEGTEPSVLRHAQVAETRELLGVLSVAERQVIDLAFHGGYTHVEIAAHLGIPLGTVKGRSNRGLARMRTALTTAAGD